MKIECTKAEWNILHAMILQNSAYSSEEYEAPLFSCTCKNQDGEIILKIDGRFVD